MHFPFPSCLAGLYAMSSSAIPDPMVALLLDSGDLMQRVMDQHPTPGTVLAISTSLRQAYPPELVAAALTQYDLRQRAAAKFARADWMWFTRAGLEQATSERIASRRAERFHPFAHVADLCCGIGGDLLALAGLPHAPHVTAVDRDPVHCALAAENARVEGLGQRVDVLERDVAGVGLAGIEAVFIDPARRNERRRLGPGQGEPPLSWCIDLVGRVAALAVKTAPGIDHDLVPEGWSLECIALGTDLKEAVLWSPAFGLPRRQATVIRDDGPAILTDAPVDEPGLAIPEAGMWLLDPNPAVTRAGLVAQLAAVAGARQVDRQIAFLVTDAMVTTPFARRLPVVASLPWHERTVKRTIRELGGGAVDVRRRGLAGDVDAISRRLRGPGERRLVVAMTRVGDRPWAIICEGHPG